MLLLPGGGSVLLFINIIANITYQLGLAIYENLSLTVKAIKPEKPNLKLVFTKINSTFWQIQLSFANGSEKLN